MNEKLNDEIYIKNLLLHSIFSDNMTNDKDSIYIHHDRKYFFIFFFVETLSSCDINNKYVFCPVERSVTISQHHCLLMQSNCSNNLAHPPLQKFEYHSNFHPDNSCFGQIQNLLLQQNYYCLSTASCHHQLPPHIQQEYCQGAPIQNGSERMHSKLFFKYQVVICQQSSSL